MARLEPAIGIIRGGEIPRILGDQGNSFTYDFPVRYKNINSILKRLIRNDQKLLPDIVRAAKELENEGVKALTTTCGFAVLYQKEIADAVSIPVFTSSLMQVPLVHRILKKEQRIGIITANATLLKREYLQAAGIEKSIPIVVAGLESKAGFNNLIRDGVLDAGKIKNEVVEVSKQLISENSGIGAIVFECANLPPYAQAVQEATGLPIFDIYTLTKMMFEALKRTSIDRERRLRCDD